MNKRETVIDNEIHVSVYQSKVKKKNKLNATTQPVMFL